jgi:hypothetical protein
MAMERRGFVNPGHRVSHGRVGGVDHLRGQRKAKIFIFYLNFVDGAKD